MLKAVLFDLDGTLLDLDGDAFLEDYVKQLGQFMEPWIPAEKFQEALWAAAVGALAQSHLGRSNRFVLIESLSSTLSVASTELWARIDQFNRSNAHHVLPGGQPTPGARRAVETARAHGLAVALATTPIYDLPVVQERLRRGHLDDFSWDLIATDQFFSTKPYPDYFNEVAERLGIEPGECLMVGDDAFNDLSARAVGMSTFYVGPPMGGLDVGPRGSLHDLSFLWQD